MLIIENLTHVYGNGKKALDEVSLTVPRGMYGLLGPNGAGKSTLMRTIATLQTPTSGHIRFGDIDVLKTPEQLRRTLGYLPQDFGVYPRVSAYDMLDHMAVLKGVADAKDRKAVVESLLAQVNLWDVRKKALAGFSGGMRQRFGIAQALIGEPSPDHRRRAHRRPRPGGAQPLPQPAGRDRRERGGDPVDPHRRGRLRPLPAMAIICDGRIVREGAPPTCPASLKGRIWMKTIDKAELEAAKAERQVISTRLFAGRTVIHVLADSDPGDGFSPVERRAGGRLFLDPADLQPRGLRPTPMFGKIAAFELRYQLRPPVFWVVAAIFFLLTFGATLDQIQIGGGGGNIHKNAASRSCRPPDPVAVLHVRDHGLRGQRGRARRRDRLRRHHPLHADQQVRLPLRPLPAPSSPRPSRSWPCRWRSSSARHALARPREARAQPCRPTTPTPISSWPCRCCCFDQQPVLPAGHRSPAR
jgi:ABC-2 type transport system ATP-binding protein